MPFIYVFYLKEILNVRSQPFTQLNRLFLWALLGAEGTPKFLPSVILIARFCHWLNLYFDVHSTSRQPNQWDHFMGDIFGHGIYPLMWLTGATN